MDIAIIGAGNVGTALASAAQRAGHTVIITSRDSEDSGKVASATGARVAASNAEAAAAGEVVILAVPVTAFPEITAEIAPSVSGKPVVDVSNRMSFSADGAEIDTSSSNAEDLAALLPEAHVVKAFNTLFATNQADPTVEGVQLDGFVAADDADAKATVVELVRSLGLNPVDAGSLARSRQLEGLAFLNITLNIAHGGSWQSGWKLVAAPDTVKVAA